MKKTAEKKWRRNTRKFFGYEKSLLIIKVDLLMYNS